MKRSLIYLGTATSFGTGSLLVILNCNGIKKKTINEDNTQPNSFNSIHKSGKKGSLLSGCVPKVYAVDNEYFSQSCRELMRHGYPSEHNLRCYHGFALSFNKRTKLSNWVMEVISKDNIQQCCGPVMKGVSQCGERRTYNAYDFKADQDCDYPPYVIYTDNSEVVPGQFAGEQNHSYSQKLIDETFTLSNSTPQIGDSLRFYEEEVRWLLRDFVRIYICSGPMFKPEKKAEEICNKKTDKYKPRKLRRFRKYEVSYEALGPEEVAMPTHFFKVILCEDKCGRFHLRSYYWPNFFVGNRPRLINQMKPVEEIEKMTGLAFFRNVKLTTVNYQPVNECRPK